MTNRIRHVASLSTAVYSGDRLDDVRALRRARFRWICAPPSPAKLGPRCYPLPNSHDGLQVGAGSNPELALPRFACHLAMTGVRSTTLMTHPRLALPRPAEQTAEGEACELLEALPPPARLGALAYHAVTRAYRRSRRCP